MGSGIENDDVTVRRLAPGDVELFRAVRLAALRDSPNAFVETSDAAEQSDWQARTVRGSTLPDRATYVAVSGGRPVGMVFVNCAVPPGPAFLGGMWVEAAFRRRGVGRSLVEHALDFLRLAGQIQVSLWVTSPHTDVFSFYEGLGFERTGAVEALREGSTLVVCELRCALSRSAVEEKPMLVIQAYAEGLLHVHAPNPNLHLSVERDAEQGDAQVLLVQYPLSTDDPAERDVNCDAESVDWSSGAALSFRIKPEHAVKLSVSFLDRNRVAYTTWIGLKGGAWQTVRIAFADMRPNPHFQPPDAKTGAPIDVSEVRGIAFAPHDETAGSFAVGKFVVSG